MENKTSINHENGNDANRLLEHDWNHMHDCVLNATWNTTKKKSTREELVEIFNKLPEDLKEDAYEWGMSDTLWRDNFIEWYEENCL